jgi:ureidoglycolate dehydrogenase (NAD+)
MIAFDPARFFGGAGLALAAATAMTEVKRQGSQVLSPGEPEYLSEAARTRTGIPIEPGLWHEFSEWSQRLALPLPAGAA